MMLLVILAAAAMTYLVDAGHFARHGAIVIAGTYQVIPKIGGFEALFAPGIATPAPGAPVGYATSLVRMLAAIPAGLVRNANLEILVLLVGGMFGILRRTGALDAGVDRLMHGTGGRKYVLIPLLMTVLGLGSTFMGLIPEYIIIIPIVALMGERLGYGRIFALAVVCTAGKIGYLTSVTNPFALVVAQPLAHVPLFSGMGFRFALFVIFMAVSIGYVFMALRPERPPSKAVHHAPALSWRQTGVLLMLLASAIVMVLGFVLWGWGLPEVSAQYVLFSLVFAVIGGLGVTEGADAFVDGARSMILGALLIGIAGAVQVILQDSFILDTLIARASDLLVGQSRVICAWGMMMIEMLLGVLVPSTSGKVTMSMPIMAPIAHLSGVSGQTTVLAFILGNGLTNMVSPTVGILLAYIAAAKVSFGDWLRFVLPLFALLLVLSLAALAVAVLTDY